MKGILLITCLIIPLMHSITNKIETETIKAKEIMSNLESWGKQHGIYISNKLHLNIASLSKKHYVTNRIILNHELLLSIPINILLSPSSSLKFSSSAINQTYNYTYSSSSFSHDDPYFTKDIKDMIFLTLLHCMPQPNNLTTFYAPYFNSYQDDLRNFPTLYTSKELNAISNSNFGIKIVVRQAYLSEESFLIKMYHDQSLNETTYLRYRALLNTKAYKINEEMTIVPFLDLITSALKDKDSNCQWRYNDYTKKIEVFSTRKLRKNEQLYLNPIDSVASDDYLLNYGSIIQGREISKAFMVDLIHHTWRENQQIKYVMKENEATNYDLYNLTYPSEFLFAYEGLAKELGISYNDNNKVQLYRLMKKNLDFYMKDYDAIMKNELYNQVIKGGFNSGNLDKILRGERNLIVKKMYMIEEWIKEMTNNININEEL